MNGKLGKIKIQEEYWQVISQYKRKYKLLIKKISESDGLC